MRSRSGIGAVGPLAGQRPPSRGIIDGLVHVRWDYGLPHPTVSTSSPYTGPLNTYTASFARMMYLRVSTSTLAQASALWRWSCGTMFARLKLCTIAEGVSMSAAAAICPREYQTRSSHPALAARLPAGAPRHRKRSIRPSFYASMSICRFRRGATKTDVFLAAVQDSKRTEAQPPQRPADTTEG